MVNVWGIHGGRTGDADSLFLQENYIALGWDRISDLSRLPPNRDAFKSIVEASYPDNKPAAIPLQAGQLYRFVHELNIGDLVCYFSRRDRLIHVGRVTGAYKYNAKIEPAYPHLRAIEWLQKYPRTHFTQTAIFELSSAMSFFSIKRHAAEFTAAAQGKVKTLPIIKHAVPKLEATLNRAVSLFVSYRRKSWAFTHRLVDHLKARTDMDIFVDLDGVDESNFEQSILKNLITSDIVLVVLSELTFAPDRIHRDNDWVRREIAMALEHGKEIVLININNDYLPSAADLPENIREIVRMQSIPFYAEYWEAAIDKLVKFLSTITATSLVKLAEPAIILTATENKPTTSISLKDAMEAFESGEYEKSIFLLNALRDAGFKSKLMSVEEILEKAMLLRDAEERRREAREEYENIAALATSKTMFGQAQAAWAKFQQQFPDFEDDDELLGERLGSAPISKLVQFVESGEETTQILASRHIKRREFWTNLLNQSKVKTDLGRGRASSTDNRLSIGLGHSGFSYNYLILMQEAGVGLYIDVGDQAKNKAIFDYLYQEKTQIEAEFRAELDWLRMDDKISCRIVKMFQGIGGLSEPESWPSLQTTMIDAMIRFDRAFRPRIAELQL